MEFLFGIGSSWVISDVNDRIIHGIGYGVNI